MLFKKDDYFIIIEIKLTFFNFIFLLPKGQYLWTVFEVIYLGLPCSKIYLFISIFMSLPLSLSFYFVFVLVYDRVSDTLIFTNFILLANKILSDSFFFKIFDAIYWCFTCTVGNHFYTGV